MEKDIKHYKILSRTISDFILQLKQNIELDIVNENRLMRIDIYDETKNMSDSIYWGIDVFFDQIEKEILNANIIEFCISIYKFKDTLKIKSICSSIYEENEFFEIQFSKTNKEYFLSDNDYELLLANFLKIPSKVNNLIQNYINYNNL